MRRCAKCWATHVAQKGSLVAPERLRFDFSHPKPISDEELAQVEDIANEIVLQNGRSSTRLMGVDDAVASGAMALFGEKYGDEVRVVSMGRRRPLVPTHPSLFGRTLRRHPCRPHRRYRPRHAWSARARLPPASAASRR